jgi:hypothetical protein
MLPGGGRRPRRKVSDEFCIPLCRATYSELHRHGDEGNWWQKADIDPAVNARVLWLQTHPLAAPNTVGNEVGP